MNFFKNQQLKIALMSSHVNIPMLLIINFLPLHCSSGSSDEANSPVISTNLVQIT